MHKENPEPHNTVLWRGYNSPVHNSYSIDVSPLPKVHLICCTKTSHRCAMYLGDLLQSSIHNCYTNIQQGYFRMPLSMYNSSHCYRLEDMFIHLNDA